MYNCYSRIKDLRIDKDLTQLDIANLLKMQVTQYRRYESGEREIPFSVVIKLAMYYNTTLDYLAGLKDVPTKLF